MDVLSANPAGITRYLRLPGGHASLGRHDLDGLPLRSEPSPGRVLSSWGARLP